MDSTPQHVIGGGAYSSPGPPPPSPSQTIESLLPGYNLISPFLAPILTALNLDITTVIGVLLLCTLAGPYWSHYYNLVSGFFGSYFMSTAQVRSRDDMYDYLLAWIATQKFAKRSRYFVAGLAYGSISEWNSGGGDDGGDGDEDGDSGEEEDPDSDDDDEIYRNHAPLQFSPAPGNHVFRYQGCWIFLSRQETEQKHYGAITEIIEISCFGRSPGVLKKLLAEARAKYLAKDKSKTIVYRPGGGGGGTSDSWKRCMSRPSRPLSTVVLDEKQKTAFVEDVRDYLDPSTSRWYARRGIPYRRGYLLHGAPGTGKSSLSFAIAGVFGLKIYVLSLASRALTEDNLATLFSSLPKRCVVLLEDIDSAGLSRVPISSSSSSSPPAGSVSAGNDSGNGEKGDNSGKAPPAATDVGVGGSGGVQPTGGGISFSGLLNAIDGVASHEGRVLIMTTNHPEKLDAALIRPGRVDMKIHFSLANTEVIEGLFEKMYDLEDDEVAASSTTKLRQKSRKTGGGVLPFDEELEIAEAEKLKAEIKKQREKKALHIKSLAQIFGQKIPSDKFSPAAIQGFLLRHKRNPEKAVEEAEKWVETKQD